MFSHADAEDTSDLRLVS